MSVTHLSSSNDTRDEIISLSAFKPKKLLDSSLIVEAGDFVKESSLPDVSEVLENGEILALDSEGTRHKLLGESGRSTSILEKLFGNTLTASSGGTSNFVEVSFSISCIFFCLVALFENNLSIVSILFVSWGELYSPKTVLCPAAAFTFVVSVIILVWRAAAVLHGFCHKVGY